MSRKDVSAVVSGAGFAAAFWVALDKACRRRGVEDKDIHNAFKDDSPLVERFADLIASASRVKSVVFRIVRDSRPVEEKVKEGFSYANFNITSQNFTVSVGDPTLEEAILVNFGEYVESEDAVERLDKMGLKPGLPTELADLSKSHPNSEKLAACLPVVALGDSWVDPGGRRFAVCLDGRAGGRELVLFWWGNGWGGGWWFLAFRK